MGDLRRRRHRHRLRRLPQGPPPADQLGVRAADRRARATAACGRVIDMLAIFATLFGSAASLGLGALQIGSGLEIVGRHRQGRQRRPRRHHRRPHRGLHRLGRLRRRQGHPVAVQHQHGAGRSSLAAVRVRRRPDGVHPRPGPDRRRRLLPGPRDDVRPHRRRGRRRREAWLAGWTDLLLGLVALVDAVRRHVHRPHLPRPHHPPVRHRRAAGAEPGQPGLVRDLRRRGDRPAAERHRHRRGRPARRASCSACSTRCRWPTVTARPGDGAGRDLLRLRRRRRLDRDGHAVRARHARARAARS